MSGTFALGLSCGRAGEPVLLRSEVFRRTEIEFFTAVGAEHHAGKQALLPLTGRSAFVFTELLNLLKCGTVNDGGMSVGKDFPILFRAVDLLFVFEGLKRVPVKEAAVGEIVCVAGLDQVSIGDTICGEERVEPIEFVKIAEPSIEMTFMVNNSPFAGTEGKFVTSRHLRDRLYKEAVKDLSLKVNDGATADCFVVRGRGEMHLSILIENMRRDGYEFQVSMPKVLIKDIDGVKSEPIDRLFLDVPEDCVGTVMNKMGVRKGELVQMTPHGNRMKMEFLIPSRGLFGFKSELLTDTRGEGIINSIFDSYQPYKGEIQRREVGSLIAHEAGEAIVYGLFNAQERGDLFITPGTKVYAGMVVGENPKGGDIVVNVCKKKHLSNCRSSGADEALRLTPPKILSLEDAIEFIADDELLEITPKNVRIRKTILDHTLRLREKGKQLRGEI